MDDLEHVDIQISTAEKLILMRDNFYKLSENKHFNLAPEKVDSEKKPLILRKNFKSAY